MNTLRSTIWFRIAYTTVALSAAIGLIVIPPFYTLLRTEASQVQLTPSPFPSPTKTTLPNYTTANSLLYRDASQITLRGINWFGFETSEHTVHGLWKRNWNSMLDQTQQLGFNAVRLPVCMDSLSGAQVRSINYTLNPELVNLSSTAVLDTIIQGMEQRGMYYIIDFHNFDCGEYNELWYTKDHTEEEWITSLTTVAHKYKDNRYFIGIDLKNEPHGAATWGTGAALTDWNLAAERAGKAVLEKNPRILVFVQGISNEKNPCTTIKGNWWGGIIEPYRCFPISSKMIPANKLVLSPHIYSASLAKQPYYYASNFPANLSTIWDVQFGNFAKEGIAIVPGEWGAKYSANDPMDRTVFKALAEYFSENNICSSFFWALNPNSHDVGGLLTDDWRTVDQEKYKVLNSLFTSCQTT